MELKILSDTKKLARISKPYKKIESIELAKLIDAMEKLMLVSAGVGLACPQIGKFIRMFIFFDSPIAHIETVINPEIIREYEQKEYFQEGCLSIPNKFVIIGRPKRVTLKYYDSMGEEIEREFRDFFARIVCHEIDHLNGILITDHK